MKRKLDKVLGGFLVMLLAIMVFAVLWQVFSRYVMKSPSSITEELARYLLIWIGILGAAYASGQQAHLSINLLGPKLAENNRKRLRIFINILIIFFAVCVLIVGGGQLVLLNMELGQSSAALKVPLYVVYLVIPLSGLVVTVYKINEIVYSEKYLV
ncbi:MAG: TRAP transporter small permease [Bacteroidota bacterium]|uniref:TRAP-type transport system, small permease component, predicted N-acetylneuraminate transporter n=1 Tax=Christiangramia flava JLT2011 TaxID=1229726 RepID=A0A1L7I705_9FLAO|nr:TRAP transporter small permease [Christiangramia flava]APU68892.1 TRAP-type transport system, small permease component, predicted N-acetylneuraminate transporter [Christiangramia flava JLT2011]MEE2772783.1 TRAP transporter small permease [Bacteroidota bacterium]OSS38962.1 TRAP-type transport system, small permease component, N-acetylneuraminate transporter [Christiangramia flava JLT2011]